MKERSIAEVMKKSVYGSTRPWLAHARSSEKQAKAHAAVVPMATRSAIPYEPPRSPLYASR